MTQCESSQGAPPDLIAQVHGSDMKAHTADGVEDSKPTATASATDLTPQPSKSDQLVAILPNAQYPYLPGDHSMDYHGLRTPICYYTERGEEIMYDPYVQSHSFANFLGNTELQSVLYGEGINDIGGLAQFISNSNEGWSNGQLMDHFGCGGRVWRPRGGRGRRGGYAYKGGAYRTNQANPANRRNNIIQNNDGQSGTGEEGHGDEGQFCTWPPHGPPSAASESPAYNIGISASDQNIVDAVFGNTFSTDSLTDIQECSSANAGCSAGTMV